MKVYVTTRFKGSNENKQEIEHLCFAVHDAGMQDFSFIRDVENYQKVFDDPKDLWSRSLEEIEKCEALLIDVSDHPSGGRVIEVGIAYALHKPVFVVVKNGMEYKDVYNGVAALVIRYDSYQDITDALKEYLLGR